MNTRTRRFTRVSGRAQAILGYPVERWRAVPGFWIGVLHPEDRERVAQAVWRVIRDRQPCEIEYRAVASDGSVVQLRDRVKVIVDAGGDDVLLQGAMVDLTERPASKVETDYIPRRRWRRGRHTAPTPARPQRPATATPPPMSPTAGPSAVLSDSPAATGFAPNRLLAAIGEAVIASDTEHRIVYWSPAAETLLGHPAESALGRTDSELLQTRTSAGQTAEILSGLLGNRPWSAEVLVHDRDGAAIPVRITASALRNNDSVAGYVAVVTDLRQVRRGEVRRSAEHSMDAVARLARGVASELNEGVAQLEAAIRNTLARVEPGDPARIDLDGALRTVDSTAALAHQLLAVGRAVETEPQHTDLQAVVQRSLPAIRLLAGAAIDVVTDLDPDTLPALVDPVVAGQILMNLAASSCQAMQDGGRLVIATSNAEAGPDSTANSPEPTRLVHLEVRDSRAPVATDVLDRFFEPFNESTVPPGMGMAAAHGLVDVSMGRISVSAQPDGGLVMSVLFRSATRSGGT